MSTIKDFLTLGFDLRGANVFQLIFAIIYLLFLLFLASYFWYNVGVFFAVGDLPLWNFIKRIF